jgi:uncharacterized tellurite resistance protein B-like protein
MIIMHQPVSAEQRQAAQNHLDDIITLLSKPGGFAKLNGVQRKFLMGIVLAAIVPVDKRIRNVELERLQLLLRSGMQVSSEVTCESVALAEGQTDLSEHVAVLAKALPDLFGIEDRCTLISQLWELALCDHELHAYEEQLVYRVADLSDVPRKRVAELMARASARA